MEQYKQYRINIRITNTVENLWAAIDMIYIIRNKIPDSNVVAALDSVYLYNINLTDKLDEKQIPYYFDTVCSSLDEFNYFLTQSVCDIKIGGELGFFLKFLSKRARENKKRLRAEVDFCRDTLPESYKSFFIRPEDIDTYSNYIDTFEFVHDIGVLNTIYEVYTRDKKWYGKLNEIILGYRGDEDSRYILPLFAEMRCGCRKRCLYEDPNKTCKMCETILKTGKSLEENGVIIKKEKVKNENSN